MKSFLLVIAAVAIMASCTKDESFIQKQETSVNDYQFIFDKPIQYSELASQIEKLGISKSSVIATHHFVFDDMDFSGFLPLKEKLTQSDFITLIDQGLKGIETESGTDIGKSLKGKRSKIIYNDNIYHISEISINNIPINKSEIQRVFTKSRVVSSEKKNVKSIIDSFNHPLEKNNTSSYWIPDAFAYRIQESSTYPGKRYVVTGMIWFNSKPFTQWSNNVAFEPDFMLNNSPNSNLGSGTYLSTSQYTNFVPKVFYAASSLPKPYLDTRFSDPSHVKTFTIGCADASKIQSFKEYKNYIVTENGQASRDNAQVVFQRGKRVPTSVYSTWSVFADISKVPFGSGWPISVPGSGTWYK